MTLKVEFSRAAGKDYRVLQGKIQRQVTEKLVRLAQEGRQSADLKTLKRFPGLWRVTSGEYRIVFRFTANLVIVERIGKRNDDEIYKLLKRM